MGVPTLTKYSTRAAEIVGQPAWCACGCDVVWSMWHPLRSLQKNSSPESKQAFASNFEYSENRDRETH